MLGSVEAGLKVIMRLEEGKNAEVDFARCSPQAAVVCLHNAPLLGRGNRQGWEILESQHCACCSVWQIILMVTLELFADFHKLTKEVQEDLLQSCICSETEKILE